MKPIDRDILEESAALGAAEALELRLKIEREAWGFKSNAQPAPEPTHCATCGAPLKKKIRVDHFPSYLKVIK